MKKDKVVKETIVTEKVDGETGEFMSSESKKTYSIAKEPNFVKLYMSDLASIYQLPKSSILVLLSLLSHTTYADEGQIVTINSYTKKQILFANREIGSTQTINNAVSHLKKIGILNQVDRATYKLNPYVIGKGEWRDILNLRLTINYSVLGREVTTEVTTNEGKATIKVPDLKETKESTDTEKSTETTTTVADTSVTPETPITGVMTSKITETEHTDTATDTATSETTRHRKGKQPMPKPANWEEIKAKIKAKEITKVKAIKELGIKTVVTLNKWLAEESAA